MLRFDDQFPQHRKVAGLSDSGFRFHVEAVFWCARNLTDGFIAQDDLGVCSRYRKADTLAAECVRRESWHRVVDGKVDPGCAECQRRYELALAEANPAVKGDGWIIHGYLDWQQTRSKVLQLRDKRAKAGSIGGKRSGQSRKTGQSSRSRASPKQTPSKPEATWLDDASPPNHPPPSEGVRASPRRADARGAAAAPPNGHTAPTCPTCGNRTDSQYHVNTCSRAARLTERTRP